MEKLYDGKLHNLYTSPNKIRQMKSRRMKWARHVASTGGEREVYKVVVGKPEENTTRKTDD
jgi:hypothetical protein